MRVRKEQTAEGRRPPNGEKSLLHRTKALEEKQFEMDGNNGGAKTLVNRLIERK